MLEPVWHKSNLVQSLRRTHKDAGFCFACGVIHIFAGMGVKAYVNIKEGRILMRSLIKDYGMYFIWYNSMATWRYGQLRINLYSNRKSYDYSGCYRAILTQGRDKKISSLNSSLGY